MAEKIQLEVVTPERRVLAEPVDMVTVPGLGGELGNTSGPHAVDLATANRRVDLRAGREEFSDARFGGLC